MKIISFLFYYIKLLLRVMLGLHITANPLNIRWRWKIWQRKYAHQRKHKFPQDKAVLIRKQ